MAIACLSFHSALIVYSIIAIDRDDVFLVKFAQGCQCNLHQSLANPDKHYANLELFYPVFLLVYRQSFVFDLFRVTPFPFSSRKILAWIPFAFPSAINDLINNIIIITHILTNNYSAYTYITSDNIILRKEIQIMKEEDKVKSISLQEDCAICLLPCTRPVKCKGPCKKFFCIKCVMESKRRSKNACPNRCSQPFQIQVLQVALRCPYSPQDCNISIPTPKHLANHFQTCLFISPTLRQAELLKKIYKCSQGHPLTFLDLDNFEVIYGIHLSLIETNEICSLCSQEKFTRTICLQCSDRQKRVTFCVDCRPFPCTKTLCPMGHRLRKTNRVGKNRYCDLCQVPAQIISTTAYGFCKCGFDLCESCHRNAVQHNDLIPVRINQKKLLKLSVMEQLSSESEWKQE